MAYKRYIISLIFLLAFNFIIKAQTSPPPLNTNGLPVDCSDAIIVCGNSDISLDVEGIGKQELNGSNNCGSQETNSIWLKLTIATDGSLGFILTPQSSSIVEDYDFFIFGPDVSCGNIGQAIRCSTTNPQAANQGNNLTGMKDSERDVSEGPGIDGNSFVKSLDVRAGDTYYLVIDRPIGNSPFSLEWTGTASFPDPPLRPVRGISFDQEKCDILAPFNDGIMNFDLSVNNNNILDGQSGVSLTYHDSASDANIGINPLGNEYTNIESPQQIYYRLTDEENGCFVIGDLTLKVSTGVDFNKPPDFILCDDLEDGSNTNGRSIFNLSDLESDLIGDLNNNAIQITYHASFSDADEAKNNLPELYVNNTRDLQEIFIRLEDRFSPDCYSLTSVNLIVDPVPNAVDTTIIQCDEDGNEDGYTIFDLYQVSDELTEDEEDRTIEFYLSNSDAENQINAINGENYRNIQNPQTVFARVISDKTLCYNIAALRLQVSLTNVRDTVIEVCDDDGLEDGKYTFDLSIVQNSLLTEIPENSVVTYYSNTEDALLENNSLGNTYTNENENYQVIYIRVENQNACYGINKVELIVNPLPEVITEEEAIYCLNFSPQPKTIDAGLTDGNVNDYLYLWSTGETTYEIDIVNPGNYSVIISNQLGCEKERTVEVLPSNIATISNIEVIDASNNNSILVTVNGEGQYEYSLDEVQGLYQDDNLFENVVAGLHTVFVRDKNSCGISSELVSIIGFPKFFTPNSDGANDVWQVKGISSEFQPKTDILIYDRYGRLLKRLDPLSKGWDGTIDNIALTSTDYWFTVLLEDGRNYTGHFSLRR